LHSVGGGSAVQFVFFNQSPNTVQIIWLTYSGSREDFAMLEPESTFSVNTYVGDVFEIVNTSGACLSIYFINGAGQVVIY
jgi:hypothetical protein